MIRTDSPPFGRILTAMVTPFDDELKLDFKAVERLVEHLIATGTDTIVVNGTTGESPTLEDTEKQDLLKLVVSLTKGRAKVVMGTGNNSTAKSVKASQDAERLGADGLLVVAPYYNKPSQEGMLKHFETVARATKLPIIVYNIPGRTGVNISSETMLRMIESSPNIHALKDSTGGVDQAAEVAGSARSDFRVYSGDDYLTLPFLSVGASGIISVASHVAGREVKAIVDHFFNGNLDAAREMHYKCLPLFKGLFAAPNPTCVKYALSVQGICKPNLRLPLIPLDTAQKQAMDKILKQLNQSVQRSQGQMAHQER